MAAAALRRQHQLQQYQKQANEQIKLLNQSSMNPTFQGIHYGVMTLGHDNVVWQSRIKKVARNVSDLNDTVDRYLIAHYQGALSWMEDNVLIFKVHDVNPDLMTWQTLQSMSTASYHSIISDKRFHPMPHSRVCCLCNGILALPSYKQRYDTYQFNKDLKKKSTRELKEMYQKPLKWYQGRKYLVSKLKRPKT